MQSCAMFLHYGVLVSIFSLTPTYVTSSFLLTLRLIPTQSSLSFIAFVNTPTAPYKATERPLTTLTLHSFIQKLFNMALISASELWLLAPRCLVKRSVNVTTVVVAMSMVGVIFIALFLVWLFFRKKAPEREKILDSRLPYRMSQDSDTFSLRINPLAVREASRYPNASEDTVFSVLRDKVSPAASQLNLAAQSGDASIAGSGTPTLSSKHSSTNKTPLKTVVSRVDSLPSPADDVPPPVPSKQKETD